jgi:hypothetical protein
MQRVIDGKRYDTETATLIGEDAFGNRGDFHAWEESLYRTPKGHFFLAGSGGARSSWGKQVTQNTWSGGEGLRAMSPAEALQWCEDHEVDADVIAEHFGDLVEHDAGIAWFSFRTGPAEAVVIEAAAKAAGLPVAEFLTQAALTVAAGLHQPLDGGLVEEG